MKIRSRQNGDILPARRGCSADASAIESRRSLTGVGTLALGLILYMSQQGFALAESKTSTANLSGQALTSSEVFLKYCAGCHGFDGFAAYEHAPSFSMGERLHKSDQELLSSVLDGKHAMPHWKNKITENMILNAIAYLRIMEQRYSSGLPPREEPLPELHYKFNPVGEDEDYWLHSE
jgi:mono/diheme cytochrome c family protein